MEFESNFSFLDWSIVAVYLAGTVAVGLYVNRYIRGMADFVVAGRSLRSLLSIATMIGSELGLVTVMYAAEKGFTGGFSAFHIGLVGGVVALLIGMTGFIVVPLRRMGVMTIPEFYQRRFGRGVRILGGSLLAFGGILNMGLFLKAGATFVTGLTGLEGGLHVKVVMTVLICLVLVYTTLGGMVSVVITDYMQFVVLSIGLLAAGALAVTEVGWREIVRTVEDVHGEAGFDPFHAEGFGTSYVLWMVMLGLVSCSIWQTAVLRACAAESTRVVRRMYVWSSIGFLIRMMIPQFLGICALAYFARTGEADVDSMQAMPIFLGRILPIGVAGFIAAGMLAAFMSTHDTYLLCWATALAEDVVYPLSNYRLAEATRLRLTRVFIVLIAAFLLIWSLWYELEQDLWDYMAITGGIYFTGAFALLWAGIYWKRASAAGAYLALLSGLAMLLGLKPIQKALEIEIDEATLGLGTVAGASLAMVVGSLLFPDRKASFEDETQEATP